MKRPLIGAASFVTGLACVLGGFASAAPGDLDSSFGTGGKVVTAVGSGDDRGHAVALQDDGKVVVAGYSYNGSNKDFCVVRYLVDGSLDTAFNGTGKATIDFGGTNDEANGMAVQADGKIIVVGGALNGSSVSVFALARLNPDGSLDTDFGLSGTGKLKLSVGSASIETLARAVKIQTDGKIVVAGHTLSTNSYDFAVIRLLPDGTLDGTFGTGGSLLTDLFIGDYGWDVELQADGKIVVSGLNSHGSLLVARYHSDGTRDTGFTPAGQSEYSYDSAIQADGKIIVAGSTVGGSADFRLVRYLPNGALDTSFGSNGVVTTGIGTAQDVAYRVEVQADGRIVAAGSSFNADTGFNDFAVVRYRTDGSLDTGFQGSGKVTAAFPGGSAIARGLAIAPDGRILLTGYAHDGTKNNLALARFHGTGNLSTTAPAHGSHTSDNTPEIRGTATPGFTVNVHIDGSAVGTTVAEVDGNWSFTPVAPLADGVHSAAATETDGMGSTGPLSNAVSFTVDTVAPAAPAITGPVADTLVNTSWPVISGTAEAGATVRVYVDEVLAGTAVASGNGNWSCTAISALANGLHAVRAESMDRAGNAGTTSLPLNFSTVAGLFSGPGTLDTSFGTGGKVTTAIGSGDDRGHAAVLQSDGKMVVAGYSHNGSNKDFCVVRYNEDGTLDPAFNTTGKVTLDFGGTNDEANGVAIQPDGRILVVGSALNGSSVNVFALARLNPDGSLDTDFGLTGTGKLKLSVGSASIETLARAVKIQTDGKIVVAGHTLSTSTYDFAVLRLLPDGTMDTGFGTGGAITTDLFINDYGWDIELQSDGKILVCGINSHGSLLVARYHSDGTRDTGFTPAGQSQYSYDSAIQADGKIIVAGSTVGGSADFRLVRYLPDGTIDSSFGNNGVVVTGIGTAQDVAYRVEVQADGRIVAVGSFFNADTDFNDFAVVRYQTDGSLDTGFQGSGKVTAGFSGGSAIARGLAIAPDGRILLAGYAHDGTKNNLALARFHGTGNLSTTAPAHGSHTSDNTPEIRGTATPGFTVNVHVDGSVVGTTVAEAEGDWTFSPAAPLADGPHAAAATETDGFGNTGPLSNVVSFTVDTVAPTVPVITEPAPDTLLNTSWPVITGTAEAGATVRVFVDEVLAGAAVASGNGTWSITVNAALANGPHAVRAESTDRAGNAGATSSPFAFATAGGIFGGPGTLDASFGTGGKVTTAVGSGDDRGHAIALQPDGKVVVAGYSHNGSNKDFCVARYLANGSLDTTFDGDGIVTTDFGGTNDEANGVAVQPDGRIVVVGGIVDGGNNKFFGLARYQSNGALDTDFGVAETGRVKTAIGAQNGNGNTEARAVKILPGGKILVAGNCFVSNVDFALLRYNAEGILDTGFGTGGAVITDMSSFGDYGWDIEVQSDGTVFVCGYHSHGSILLARYQPDGTKDAFPVTWQNQWSYAVTQEADGKLLVLGSTVGDAGTQNFRLTRYNGDGTLDGSFGTGGSVVTGIGTAQDVGYDVAVQPEGRIVAAGFSYNADTGFTDFAVARYQTDGSLDTNFKSTGKVLGGFTSGNAEGRAMAIAPDGRILVAGYAHDGAKNNIALIKLFGTDQPPLVETGDATGIVRAGAVLNGSVNPNSLATTFHFEYGTTTDYGGVSSSAAVGNGYQSQPVALIIGGLTDNTLYHYRLAATNAAGTTYGEDRTFTTAPNPPLAYTGEASNITATSATLVGVAVPNGRETTVYFKYGLTTNYGATTAPQILPANATLVDVFAPVSSLTPGSTYHFHLVAINAGSPIPIHGEDKTFLAQSPPPVVSLGATAPHASDTTAVIFHGTVNASDDTANVFFDYDSDLSDGLNFPNSLAATPPTVTGSQDESVSAVLSGLSQGVTYHYRLRAVNGGVTAISEIASFTLDVISGLASLFPDPDDLPEHEGFLTIYLRNGGQYSGWRFAGEHRWRASGVPVGGLTTSDREIEFRPVPGLIHPPSKRQVSIFSGGAGTVETFDYFSTEETGTGRLRVTLKPDSIATDDNIDRRAQWRLEGNDESPWLDSGAEKTLLPGSYLLEFKPVEGRNTPPNTFVTVNDGPIATPVISYFLAGDPPGDLPTALAFEAVSADQSKPYAFVGQIRSSEGLGTGFAAKERVVATAAHVVWNDATYASAEDLQWLHQRHKGIYEPEPMTPRGFYILSSYDEQRRLENTPGTFSMQSRNEDVAALYFYDEDEPSLGLAARGGFSGFLASDLPNNEFLLSDANKILVGYPVDSVALDSQGRMHATAPANIVFTPVGIAAERVFLTNGIRSTGGASGGPICVQLGEGNYLPAAIYLGGVSESVVRSIDSKVIELFRLAGLSSLDGKGNHSSGSTHTNPPAAGDSGATGSLEVTIEPAGARAAGAGWRLRPDPSSWRSSRDEMLGLNPGRSHILEFRPVPGYQTPAQQEVSILPGGNPTKVDVTYSPLPPEIAVIGNGLSIADGDNTPSSLDHTDFGIVAVGAGTRTRTYTIMNTGTGSLSVGNVAVGGTHPGDFTVSLQPGGNIAPGESTSFQVVFDPSADGTRYATLSFANGDADENPCTFTIRGNAGEDADGNGFSDAEEVDLGGLFSNRSNPLILGRAVRLDLGFLELGPGGSLAVLGLPPGLVFDPSTGWITGVFSGEAGAFEITLQKKLGVGVVPSLTAEMTLVEPARLEVGKLRTFAGTRVGRSSRPQILQIGNAGGAPLKGLAARMRGKAARDYLLTGPTARTVDPEDSTKLTVVFKPRRNGRRSAGILVRSSEGTSNVPVSGTGK